MRTGSKSSSMARMDDSGRICSFSFASKDALLSDEDGEELDVDGSVELVAVSVFAVDSVVAVVIVGVFMTFAVWTLNEAFGVDRDCFELTFRPGMDNRDSTSLRMNSRTRVGTTSTNCEKISIAVVLTFSSLTVRAISTTNKMPWLYNDCWI